MRIAAAASLVVVLLVSAEAHAQRLASSPPSSLAHRLSSDTREVILAPARWTRADWARFAGVAALVGAAVAVDEELAGKVRLSGEEGNDAAVRIADIVEPFGQEYSWAVIGGFYAAGRGFHNQRWQTIGEEAFAASLISGGLVVPAMKGLTGRERPSSADDAYDFFDAGPSFPSGHTTQAFAVASVIASNYDSWWVKSAAFGVAGMVGAARITHDAHYLSDVVAGAAIGTFIGRTVVRFHGHDGALSVTPLVSRDGEGVQLSMHF